MQRTRASKWQWAMPWLVALAVILLTSVSRFYAYSLTVQEPERGEYQWLAFNAKDPPVYFSWIEEYRSGAWTHRNLFTTFPELGLNCNFLFLLLGKAGALSGLSNAVIHESARWAGGFALVLAFWWFTGLLWKTPRERIVSLLVFEFSSGLGWLPFLWDPPVFKPSIDIWQPEAISFTSIHYGPIFSIPQALMIGMVGWFLWAEANQSVKAAFVSGLFGLLLGNIHSYDVAAPLAAMAAFLVLRQFKERKADEGGWRRFFVVAALTSVSASYVYVLTKIDPVFGARVNVPTLSNPFWWVLLGYGLLIPLAIFGFRAMRSGHWGPRTSDAGLLLALWAAAHFAAIYLPVPYQGKLIMGMHVPISLLAGAGVCRAIQGLKRTPANLVAAAVVLMLSLSNIRWILRDLKDFQTKDPRMLATILPEEVEALHWIRAHTTRNEAFQALPWLGIEANGTLKPLDYELMLMGPSIAGRKESVGHWGETPHSGLASFSWVQIWQDEATDEERRRFLVQAKVTFLVFSQRAIGLKEPSATRRVHEILRQLTSSPSAILELEFQNSKAEVYRVIR